MSLNTIVFAYHDIGCTGIEALRAAGYTISAVFTHADDPKENRFSARSRSCARAWASRCTRPKTPTTRCG